ncbi:MAG: hypothetical protein M1540_00425 [Candidatus Bathyarchaeota archaeon]|nr:hypothetical protein [Candidatus Bathyarchaeota archaeon]
MGNRDGTARRGMVSTQGLAKTYPVGERKITVLSDVNLQIKKATFAVICGP